jgi:hypothetical protein
MNSFLLSLDFARLMGQQFKKSMDCYPLTALGLIDEYTTERDTSE